MKNKKSWSNQPNPLISSVNTPGSLSIRHQCPAADDAIFLLFYLLYLIA